MYVLFIGGALCSPATKTPARAHYQGRSQRISWKSQGKPQVEELFKAEVKELLSLVATVIEAKPKQYKEQEREYDQQALDSR